MVDVPFRFGAIAAADKYDMFQRTAIDSLTLKKLYVFHCYSEANNLFIYLFIYFNNTASSAYLINTIINHAE